MHLTHQHSTRTLPRNSSGAMCRPAARLLPAKVRKPFTTVCQAAAPSSTQLDLHVGETTICIPFSLQQLQQLDVSINKLLVTFSEKQKAERPRRWDMMECCFKGDPAAGELELIEFFCNPNAHTTAFDAKLLITIKDGRGIRITTEGRLSSLKADVDALKAQAQ